MLAKGGQREQTAGRKDGKDYATSCTIIFYTPYVLAVIGNVLHILNSGVFSHCRLACGFLLDLSMDGTTRINSDRP